MNPFAWRLQTPRNSLEARSWSQMDCLSVAREFVNMVRRVLPLGMVYYEPNQTQARPRGTVRLRTGMPESIDAVVGAADDDAGFVEAAFRDSERAPRQLSAIVIAGVLCTTELLPCYSKFARSSGVAPPPAKMSFRIGS